MTIHQTGDRYLLEGNSQSLFIDGLSKALVFIEGSNDNLFDDFSTNVTVAMFGHNDSIHQYGGNPTLTILGFNASDSLDLYGLLPNPNGTGFEPPRTPIIAANLHPDGHGGWILPLAGPPASYVEFAFTKEFDDPGGAHHHLYPLRGPIIQRTILRFSPSDQTSALGPLSDWVAIGVPIVCSAGAGAGTRTRVSGLRHNRRQQCLRHALPLSASRARFPTPWSHGVAA